MENSIRELHKQSLETHMNTLISASHSYDKAILSLSTASLGFTFAFIKLISRPIHSCLLPFTWFFLITAILLTLLSFLIDQEHSAHRISFEYWHLTKEGKEIEKGHWTDNWLFILQFLSGISFLSGIILFAIFVSNFM